MAHTLLVHGDSQQLPLADQSVHTVCTSPPYFNLRVYIGVAPSCWPGGAYAPVPGASPIRIPGPTANEMAACAHAWGPELHGKTAGGGGNAGMAQRRDAYDLASGRRTVHAEARQPVKKDEGQGGRDVSHGATCLRCGCWCGTLGNEPDVASYIWHTLLWLREVRRCLRDDGVAWVVLGDGFAGNASHAHEGLAALGAQYRGGGQKQSALAKPAKEMPGLPDGALLGIPGLVHQAALADGWVVRDEVMWIKASPMPESVAGWRWQPARCACVSHMRGQEPSRNGSTPARPQSDHDPTDRKNFAPATPDPNCLTCGGTGRLATEVLRKGSWRHTRTTESVLMLTKGMGYFANSEAVREAGEWRNYGPETIRRQRNVGGRTDGFTSTDGGPGLGSTGTRNPRGAYGEPSSAPAALTTLRQWLTQYCPGVLEAYEASAQNPQGLLRPTPQGLAGAHYAAFPEELVERLIQATCPARCCPTCGMGWAPIVEPPSHKLGRHGQAVPPVAARGLRPTCAHYCTCGPLAPSPGLLVQNRDCPRCAKLLLSIWTPGLVYDPFAGSGTTLAVARALGRHGIGTDRSWPYLHDIARARLGLADLAAWQGDPAPPRPMAYTDLPLFAQGGNE
jgi:DNA methylase